MASASQCSGNVFTIPFFKDTVQEDPVCALSVAVSVLFGCGSGGSGTGPSGITCRGAWLVCAGCVALFVRVEIFAVEVGLFVDLYQLRGCCF